MSEREETNWIVLLGARRTALCIAEWIVVVAVSGAAGAVAEQLAIPVQEWVPARPGACPLATESAMALAVQAVNQRVSLIVRTGVTPTAGEPVLRTVQTT